MNRENRPSWLNYPYRGISLVELTISVVLLSVIAMSVGLALHGTHQQTQEATVSLTRFQQEKILLHNLAEEIRWASEIIQLNTSEIQFVCPDPDNPGSDCTVTYTWNIAEQELYRSCDGSDPDIFLTEVYQFTLQACDFGWTNDGQRYLRSAILTIQLSDQETDAIQKYIHLSNFPLW